MKILISVNVDWFFLSHRLDVAVAALMEGHEVHVVTALTESKERLEAYGFIVHPVSIDRSSKGLLGTLKLFYDFVRIYRVVKPDVVHLVTIKPVLVGGLAARIVNVPGIVYAVSGLGHVFISDGAAGKLSRTIVGWWYRFILNFPNMRIIFQNPDDRKAIENVANLPPEKVVMIPGSGVDLSEYVCRPLPEGETVVLMAARLLKTKGVVEFIQAARLIKKRHPSVRFLLIGSPDPANPGSVSASEIIKWREERVVELLGHRFDISQLMQQAHIVTLPSYYGEGLPKVLIEAAASGRAVVTTDMPGCRDAIVNGVTGLVVPAKDSKALADALLKLIENRQLCVDMGIAGRKRAENIFDIKAVVQAHLEIYDELRTEI